MMNKIIKRILLPAALMIAVVFPVSAQKWKSELKELETKIETKYDSILQKLLNRVPDEAYDPLTPQAFVFDKEHNVFGAVNTVKNTIDILELGDDNISIMKTILVDTYEGRHDVRNIYRPQGIAIYDGYIVFLASKYDSCYMSVLNLQGDELSRFYYKGNATSFSYNKESKQMYVAGQNPRGYDLIVLSTENGIENMSEDAPALHYQKEKKDEIIKATDPSGLGVMAVAMSTVFVALLLLIIIFSNTEKMMKTSRKMWRKTRDFQTGLMHPKVAKKVAIIKEDEPSGEEFAAIAAAIYAYNNELHDEENTILTIEKAKRAWTPWNAKYFGMNSYFMKKNR